MRRSALGSESGIRHWRRFAWLACGLALIGGAQAGPGCATETPPRPDDAYLITLHEADELDYRIAWQSVLAVSSRGELIRLYPFEDMLVGLEDGYNIVSSITSRDGSPMWEEPVGDRLERLLGLVRLDSRLVVNTQSDIYLLDTATGRQQVHQRFGSDVVASTAPIMREGEAIVGTPDGRVVYHNFEAGLARAAYRFDAAVDQDLVSVGDAIALVTREASVYLHDPYANTQLWRNEVLDPIMTTPAHGSFALYIAGADQSVWAFRLRDGRLAWRHRTQAPLLSDPVVLDDVVYQAVPNEGLVALDGLTGEVDWVCPEVEGGTVLTETRDQLIVWQQRNRGRGGSTFYRVDIRNGDLLGRADAESIALAAADNVRNGTIFGATRKGRVVKLIP